MITTLPKHSRLRTSNTLPIMNVTRPGISEEFLQRHNIRYVDEVEAESLIGFPVKGIYIPYPGLGSPQLMVDGLPFGRIRVDDPVGAKYLQRKGTGSQLYIPGGVPFGKELVITEGEFKALALCESGIRAVAIGGITCAMHDGKLIPGLAAVLKKYPITSVIFLGDSDTCFIYDFSREACKLAKALPERCKLKVARVPLFIAKGIDDLKESLS